MPRPAPRVLLPARVSPAGLAAVDQLAAAADVSRSAWVRAALAVCIARPDLVAAHLKGKQ